tara:strand:- start:448 stop:1377 length:930 start_codon:yes stop_codon:yes gene_type:complete
MHIQTIILIVLLVSKMAQLKHSKKVEPNDAFIGILILYILIQSLTSNTKEFAIPGAENTVIDETAWNNLHTLLGELYSGGTLKIPGNVHILGDLLVGTYNGGGTTPKTYEESKLNAASWRDSAGVEQQPPEVGTGSIYAWAASHQETLTTFIYRARTDGIEGGDMFFCSRAEYDNKDRNEAAITWTGLKSGRVLCGRIEGGDIFTGHITVDPLCWIRTDNLSCREDSNLLNMHSNVKCSSDLEVGLNCRFNAGIRIQGIKTNSDAHDHREEGNWMQMHGDAVKCYGAPDNATAVEASGGGGGRSGRGGR